MIARTILLGLLPVAAVIALTQSRRLSAIIGMGLFSFMLAAVYALLQAPDVAVTEATIGAALVTAIYVLAIRRTGRLIVVADEAPGLIAREGSHIVGLEYELLEGFARHMGLDLSVSFVPLRRVGWLVAHQEADMGAGGLVPGSGPFQAGLSVTSPHLETGVYSFSEAWDAHARPLVPDFEGYFSELLSHDRLGTISHTVASLDLARVLALGRSGATLQGLKRIDGPFAYAFLVSDRREELRASYASYLEQLRTSGQLERMVERYFS